ncbi:MAG: ABC transporter substrate-binding protein [Acidobacteriia bacterium]|nr:ABC transporter substrate-binding protein [Terriglobia bacterium]
MKLKIMADSITDTRTDFWRRGIASISAGIVMVCVLISGGFVPARASEAQGEPLSTRSDTRAFTDETGRRVNVPPQVNRIVSLAPNLTEIVFALKQENHLAGDTDFCDYPPEAAQKPHVGGPVNPNLEEIVKLHPDLILATSINRRETVDALVRLGLPVYVTDPHSLDEMIASVERIGSVLGAEKSAAALAENLRARLADLDRRLAGAAPRRALFVVWTDPLSSIGRGTFVADALRHAGARSVVETDTEWPRISLEEIIHLQPEFLVFVSEHAGDTPGEIEALSSRPGWRDLDAIHQGKIVFVSEAIIRPVPRIVDVIEQLARGLHPEAFAALNAPSAYTQPAIKEACACAR